jgi:hypothetical protein
MKNAETVAMAEDEGGRRGGMVTMTILMIAMAMVMAMGGGKDDDDVGPKGRW